MKKEVIERCLSKEMLCKDGAALLKMHPKSFSRLKTRFLNEGEDALMPKKPGPKHFTPYNKTQEWVEEKVEEIALDYLELGPWPLSEKLWERERIVLHPTTIWRILKRRKVRYTREYKRWKKEPKFYCLDQPGEEIQLDGSYPFGRERKVVSLDSIDDCSRWTYSRFYNRETAENAINFVKHLIVSVPFTVQRIRVDNRYGREFKNFCLSQGIEVEENDPYTPEQNGKVERFHRTLKREFFFRECSFQDDLETLNYKYRVWQSHYNTQRRHSGFGMNRMTPREKILNTLLLSIANKAEHYPQKVTSTLQQYKIGFLCFHLLSWCQLYYLL